MSIRGCLDLAIRVPFYVSAHAVHEWRTSLATSHLTPSRLQTNSSPPLSPTPVIRFANLFSPKVHTSCVICHIHLVPPATTRTRARGRRAVETSTTLQLKQAKSSHATHQTSQRDEILQAYVLLGHHDNLCLLRFSSSENRTPPKDGQPQAGSKDHVRDGVESANTDVNKTSLFDAPDLFMFPIHTIIHLFAWRI